MTRDRNRPTVPEVAPLVHAYYDKPGNSAGGNLHVVLDDGNFEDSFIEHSLDRATKIGDSDAVKIAELMLQMSMTQRRKLTYYKR